MSKFISIVRARDYFPPVTIAILVFHQQAIQSQLFIINHNLPCSECYESCIIIQNANN